MAISQHPLPGDHLIRFRGDTITFRLTHPNGVKGQAWLRTNIGYSHIHNQEVVAHAEQGLPPLSRDWHDYPMKADDDGFFSITLSLLDVGCFAAKCFFIPDQTEIIEWPEGADTQLKVEPAETCAANIMYTAFVRQFGAAKFSGAVPPEDESTLEKLDKAGYAVIPSSGTFRDLIRELDFIIGTLRCRIIQLLPVHPTPTTYARMGRFGSPFAVMDLLEVDPSLAEFDRQTTPLDQFGELADEVHRRNARLFLDIPINHTGWASHLQIRHPEWFHRNEDDSFMSPGAWGILWEDLSKLDYQHHELWTYMAEVFLFWCRRGVDGFRCDAGYKVPFPAWEYIIAKVRLEYPDTIFMLEGLGGYRHVTEHLLAESGMNWAYSEIFQNMNQDQIDHYLPESMHVSRTLGNLIHFAETHDNLRLAATSHTFARLRTGFCALTAQNGAFGFANGVEWYADEKIDVHEARSLNWSAQTNMIDWLRRIHAIMEIHPAYHAGDRTELITRSHHNTVAVQRTDESGAHTLLILANLNTEHEAEVAWSGNFTGCCVDLLSGDALQLHENNHLLPAGAVYCLSQEAEWAGKIDAALELPFPAHEICEQQRIHAAAMELYTHFNREVDIDVERYTDQPKALCQELAGDAPIVTTWAWPQDTNRTVMLPPGHFLLITVPHSFIAELKAEDGVTQAHAKSIRQTDGAYFVLIHPQPEPDTHCEIMLKLTVFEPDTIQHSETSLLLLTAETNVSALSCCQAGEMYDADRYAICTNQHGALSQVRIAWSEIRSKYDSLLSANLDPAVPVDRHTMLTRCRAWILYRGYSNELSLHCQKQFAATDEGRIAWLFTVPVGEGKLIVLEALLEMHPDTNAIRLRFTRRFDENDPEHLPAHLPVTLIIRPDIEDRTNHTITKAYSGPEQSFPAAIQPQEQGFSFTPSPDRPLNVLLSKGDFFIEPEWLYSIPHPIDAERGLDADSDLFSPGYFTTELAGSDTSELIAFIGSGSVPAFTPDSETSPFLDAGKPLPIAEAMKLSMQQFVVQRDAFKTVIAGYPWFLDWGRDTLICLRGLIAAEQMKDAKDILLQFARFEKGGTLPNMIRGKDDRNRETSDAPLWFFVACREWMDAQHSEELLQEDCGGRTLLNVLVSLAEGLIAGTDNGIHIDEPSGLLFSPSHFTWMDTNYPAGTPREGYPIEIQALWHYALRVLTQVDGKKKWSRLAQQVADSISELYVITSDEYTYLADNLLASPGLPAHTAKPDDALRSNQLLALTLGAVSDPTLSRHILEACEQLIVPGAIRSLADQPVEHPAQVYRDGELLNDPQRPYWGHYSGDEDTRRKPAYHNGTAWTWPFPTYAEALVQVYGESARPTALALLGSSSVLINHGCLRQVPEVLDGNAPHTQRGCGAQAWGVTELYRVIHKLQTED